MYARSPIISLFVLTVVGSQTMQTAKAEMLVVESNVPEIQTGTRLPDNPAPALRPGGRVKVLLLSSNETKVFERKGEAKARGAEDPWGGTRSPR
jgi:hypothetical protein